MEEVLKILYRGSGSLVDAESDNEMKRILEKLGESPSSVDVRLDDECTVKRCQGLGFAITGYDVDEEETSGDIALLFSSERAAENAADDYDEVADFIRQDLQFEITDIRRDDEFVLASGTHKVTLASAQGVPTAASSSVSTPAGRGMQLLEQNRSLVERPQPAAIPHAATPRGLGSRGNPVPLGQAMQIWRGDVPGWRFVVTGTKPNATEGDLAPRSPSLGEELLRMLDDPPARGTQFFMVELEAKYLGPGTASLDPYYEFKVVGQSGVVYNSVDHSCTHGLNPDFLPVAREVVTGGGIKGWECWKVSSADADSLQLLVQEGFGGDGRILFDLN